MTESCGVYDSFSKYLLGFLCIVDTVLTTGIHSPLLYNVINTPAVLKTGFFEVKVRTGYHPKLQTGLGELGGPSVTVLLMG